MAEKPDAADQAGAPGTIDLGDPPRTFLVPQATDADLMGVRKYLKKFVKQPLDMYGDLLKDPKFRTLPRKVRDELAKEAGQLRMRGEVALSAEMSTDMLQEAKYCRFFAWTLLRKADATLKLEDFTAIITDENASAVFFELARESGMDSLGN